MKKILLVARVDSVHTARWVEQINAEDWKVYIFPSTAIENVHPTLNRVVILLSFFARIRLLLERADFRFLAKLVERVRAYFENSNPDLRVKRLKRLIERLKPDIVHSMEIQAAGYLALDAKNGMSGKFPPWLVTNWGSDIYLFGRLAEHAGRIRNVMAECDFYSCECERDIGLAREFGFNGTVLPVNPNSGGFNLASIAPLRCVSVQSRKLIMLKGYQGWAGRALVGLRALELCAELLNGYTIVIYSAAPEVLIAAELFSKKTGVKVQILPQNTAHQEILMLHGQARISLGLSISDAISVSLQEAMVMGSFPIQSCTACADEWLLDGVSGFIVPPEDPEPIATAIRTALTDDALVDNAANINWKVAQERLEQGALKKKAVGMYYQLLGSEPAIEVDYAN
jgi:hypothetical protein